MKRLFTILLALLILLPTLAACQNPPNLADDDEIQAGNPGAEVESPTQTESQESTSVPTDSATQAPLPSDDSDVSKPIGGSSGIDFNEFLYVIGVSARSDYLYQIFSSDEDSGDVINSSLYVSRVELENKYNVTIREKTIGNTATDMAAAFQPYFMAVEDTISLLAVDLGESGFEMIRRGYLWAWNMESASGNAMEYLNLDAEWWNKDAIEALSVKDRQYYLVGDITWMNYDQTPVCFFNQSLANENIESVGDLFQIVRDDEWTLDRMLNIAKAVSDENSGFYGLTLNTETAANGFAYLGGASTAVSDKKGNLTLTYETETLRNTANTLRTFLAGNHAHTFAAPYDEWQVNGTEVFGEGRALFALERLGRAEQYRKTLTPFIGILPYPKADEKQSEYYAYAGENLLACALPGTATDFSRNAIILEALCEIKQENTLLAKYEKYLMGLVKRDDESEEMLDLIFDGIVYDLSSLLCPEAPLKDIAQGKVETVADWADKHTASMRAEYNKLLQAIEEQK